MKLLPLIAGALSLALAGSASAETNTVATVNNGDMIRMQKLTDDFTAKNPDITVEWVTLEENALRQKVTDAWVAAVGSSRSSSRPCR